MKKLKLYLDTTIWNFPFADDAPERQAITIEFFKQVRWGRFEVFASEAVAVEIGQTREALRLSQLQGLWREINPLVLEGNDEVERLAGLYLRRRALKAKCEADAVHVAFAAFYGMDVLLTWNMKDLANVNRRNKVAGINLEEGYGSELQITNPSEVIGNE